MPLQRPDDYFNQIKKEVKEEKASAEEPKRLKSPSSLFPSPPAPEPVVENIVEEIIVEKIVEKEAPKVSVDFNMKPFADMREGIISSVSNISNELSGKADIGSLIRIREDLESYTDEIKSAIDSLDIRHYEEQIDSIYDTLGELADVIDGNLESLSKLTGRDIKELRDEFSVMFTELQESISSAAEKNLKELAEVHSWVVM